VEAESSQRRQTSNPKWEVSGFYCRPQGGGEYAAYHTALSLARLYDSCSKLKDHVFAISSVSGGSFGAALFSELLRKSGTLGDTCSVETRGPGAFENSVRQFFSNDFVAPVIATFFFDAPALLIPQIRVMPDRARTLELAFQYAISSGKDNRGTEFYSSWSATGQAPALFLNTTSTNYGVPIILSQLYMADARSSSLLAMLLKSAVQTFAEQGLRGEELARRSAFDAVQENEYTRRSYFNILEYRPELQLTLATAAVLSARFPYVTPPGLLYSDTRNAAADNTLRETTALELIDGGFWDNSGIATANEILRQLRSASEIQEFVSNVDFHLISFGHARAALQMQGARHAQSELIAPITTFDAVRQARRFRLTDATAAGFALVYNYELFDHEFQAPLSWTLSSRIRGQIEDRSGGDIKPTLCCVVSVPEPLSMLVPQARLNLPKAASKSGNGLRLVAPNVDHYRDIIRTVRAASEKSEPVGK
jgi:hypothetical protein